MNPAQVGHASSPQGPVIVVANPLAGAGRAGERAARLVAALQARGQHAHLVVPDSAAATRRLATELAPKAAVLVACGGDGTANIVMNACLPVRTAFGLLPAGTGDDNARELCMPRDPDRAAGNIVAALTGSRGVPDIDVAMAVTAESGERAYLGVMSTGIDSTVNERANRGSRLPGTARYVAALAAELRRMRPVEYVITVDDVELRQPALLASIGNGSSYGGGMRVCPKARVDDGVLDVTVLSHVSRTTFVRVFPSVFRGTHVRHPAVTTLRGGRISVAASGAIAYADGERLGPLPVTVTVRSKALRLIGAETA